MRKILVFGNTCADVIIRVPHLPSTAEDVEPTSQSLSLGGSPFNAANVVRQAGIPLTFMTPTGTGLYGEFVRRGLVERGFPLTIPCREENGCCYCLVEPNGERTFLSYHGVEYTFHREWMKDLNRAEYCMIYFSGFEVEEPTGAELVAWLANFRRQFPDCTFFFAPGPRILTIAPDRLKAVLALHPILHVNEDEARRFSGIDDLYAAAECIRARTGNTVVITLAEKGSYALPKESNTLLFAPAVPTRIADTIGAGDSHIGQLMTSLYRNRSLQDALMDANIVSSAVVSVPGASLPDDSYRALLPKLGCSLLAE